jgi:predicted RNA-binding Zn-ribbon protein involved in translation (DUF1610 family)
MSGEPKHTAGHSMNIKQSGAQHLCPECGKAFNSKEEANTHLHSSHKEHLRSKHPEYHS